MSWKKKNAEGAGYSTPYSVRKRGREAPSPTYQEQSNEGFRDYCLLLMLIDTGIRLSELAYLKTDDIDYEHNFFRAMGKGQRERFVPFGHRVAKALMRYQMKCRPVSFIYTVFCFSRQTR